MEFDLLYFFRLVNIALTVIGISFWSYFYAKYRECWVIAPITWLVNLGCFYVFVFSAFSQGPITHEIGKVINTWSTLLHTHAGILLVSAAYIKISYSQRKSNGKH